MQLNYSVDQCSLELDMLYENQKNSSLMQTTESSNFIPMQSINIKKKRCISLSYNPLWLLDSRK